MPVGRASGNLLALGKPPEQATDRRDGATRRQYGDGRGEGGLVTAREGQICYTLSNGIEGRSCTPAEASFELTIDSEGELLFPAGVSLLLPEAFLSPTVLTTVAEQVSAESAGVLTRETVWLETPGV